MRTATHAYRDPLDRIWLTAAERIGLRVERTADAYASTPGDGVLLLASGEHLDPDDCVAQMVFHELCHFLVQGEASFEKRDWGLDNETEVDVVREHACLRTQAVLAARHGLRRVLAPTTDFRSYYDALPADPLEPRWDPAVTLAIHAVRRATSAPWAPHLEEALKATSMVARSVAPFAAAPGELWGLVDEVPGAHPTGLPPALPVSGRSCGTCAWRTPRGRCRQAESARVYDDTAACERWEPVHDCQTCGACCRAAYDLVQVSARDPVRKKHPSLVVLRGPFFEMRREGDRCAALEGGRVTADAGGRLAETPYRCAIYEDRPKSCREFERGGDHCLVARRRVGLSL